MRQRKGRRSNHVTEHGGDVTTLAGRLGKPCPRCAGRSAWPHSLQNLAGAAYSTWHWGQRQELCGSDEAKRGLLSPGVQRNTKSEWRQSSLTRYSSVRSSRVGDGDGLPVSNCRVGWKCRAIRVPHTWGRTVDSSGGFAVLSLRCRDQRTPAARGDLSDVELVRRKRRGLDLCDLRGSQTFGVASAPIAGRRGARRALRAVSQWTREPVLRRLRNALGRSFCASDAARLRPGHRCAGGFERRHVTVLFCDVVGLPLLAASLDPEELNDVIQRYYEIFARANARFDGCVASLSTDGTLAIFGYPNAHEDDAERAVRAAQAAAERAPAAHPQYATPDASWHRDRRCRNRRPDRWRRIARDQRGGRSAEPRRAAAIGRRAGHHPHRIWHASLARRSVRTGANRADDAEGVRRTRDHLASQAAYWELMARSMLGWIDARCETAARDAQASYPRAADLRPSASANCEILPLSRLALACLTKNRVALGINRGRWGAMQVNEIYFQPPLAIARVGPGRSPMPNFRWVIDRTIHGGHRTAVQPDVTLSVKPNGALTAELPDHIEFREDGKLRPVAPFFELWARYVDAKGKPPGRASNRQPARSLGRRTRWGAISGDARQPQGATPNVIGRLQLRRRHNRRRR